MKEVGDKFGAGELILPFVLQSAEVMKKAVSHLEQLPGTQRRRHQRARWCWQPSTATCTTSARTWSRPSSPTTATRSSTWANRSPPRRSSAKAVEVKADAIGLSALLVSTSKQMPLIVNELQRRGLSIPGADRRRGHQPPLRAAHPADR